ncbi:hypothetical protein TNCV_2834281 [Trichonephila clavipes]|nr:hypothetical protein TNCV_2834281 [Trichonephila clavipes]
MCPNSGSSLSSRLSCQHEFKARARRAAHEIYDSSILPTGFLDKTFATTFWTPGSMTATVGSDVVQSGRPIFDDFLQHLWPYIGNNTVNVVFQMVQRLWLIRIDQ